MILVTGGAGFIGSHTCVALAEAGLSFIVLDNFSPHRSTKTDTRVGDWAAANNVELAFVPFYGSWLNRIEAQFTGLRYFALDGTDHNTHREQASLIRRYIIWRNSHATDPRLRKVLKRAAIIKRAKVA